MFLFVYTNSLRLPHTGSFLVSMRNIPETGPNPEENILNVDQLELTNVPWCVVHATLRNSKHCKNLGKFQKCSVQHKCEWQPSGPSGWS